MYNFYFYTTKHTFPWSLFCFTKTSSLLTLTKTDIFYRAQVRWKKKNSELHLCTGSNTRGFSCLKWNFIVVTLALLPNEAGINLVSTSVSAACTSQHTHIDTHTDDHAQMNNGSKKRKRKKNFKIATPFKSKSLWLQWRWANLHQLRFCSCIYFRKDAILS